MVIKSKQKGAFASQSRLLLLNNASGVVEGKVTHGRRRSQGKIFQKISSFTGFTLLEVLIALVIVTIPLLGLVSLATITIKSNTFGNDYTVATSLAQDALEFSASLPFANLASGDDGGPIDEEGTVVAGAKYTRIWTVTDIVVNSTKSLEVKVSWTSSYGTAKDITLTTVRSNT